MKTYKVACQVPEDKLHLLIKYYEALGVTAFTVNLSVQQPANAAPAPTESPRVEQREQRSPRPAERRHQKFHYIGGKRNKGVSARELILQILSTSADPIVSCEEMRVEFLKHGFAKTSISSPLSILNSDKKIVHAGEGLWALSSRYMPSSNSGVNGNGLARE